MSQVIRIFSLEGKDFLDQWEAAHYMCMSVSKFKQLLDSTDIKVLNNHGKTVYRKTELTAVIEKQND
jgi:hypothetical protein